MNFSICAVLQNAESTLIFLRHCPRIVPASTAIDQRGQWWTRPPSPNWPKHAPSSGWLSDEGGQGTRLATTPSHVADDGMPVEDWLQSVAPQRWVAAAARIGRSPAAAVCDCWALNTASRPVYEDSRDSLTLWTTASTRLRLQVAVPARSIPFVSATSNPSFQLQRSACYAASNVQARVGWATVCGSDWMPRWAEAQAWLMTRGEFQESVHVGAAPWSSRERVLGVWCPSELNDQK